MDVLATGDDHVVHAADDPEVAVPVDPADVSGVVPAFADRLLVGVGPVPVSGEGLVGGMWQRISPVLAELEAQRHAPGGPRSPASQPGRDATEYV